MKEASINRLRRHRALFCALGLNIVFLLLCVCCSHMRFGTNDDRDISNLLANVYGDQDGCYIAFVNVFLCNALAALYAVTADTVNWYVLLSVIVSFAALTSISYLLLRRARHFAVGFLLSTLLLAVLSESHYVVFQFTQNAALYTAAGMLLLVDILQTPKGKGSILRGGAGGFFILIGTMLRFQALYFALPYMALFTGYEMLFARGDVRLSRWMQENWKTIAAMLLFVILAVGLRFGGLMSFRSNPETQNYYEENKLRAELLDYGLPDYDTNAEALRELGITKEDLEMFSNQSYLDRDVFSRDVIETLVDMKAEKSSSYSAKNLKLSAIKSVFSVPADRQEQLYWVAFLGVVLFLLLCMERRQWLLLFGTLAIMFAMLWYFNSVGRLPYRVWYSIAAPGLIFGCYLGAQGGQKPISGAGNNVARYRAGQALLVALCITACTAVLGHAAEDDTVMITDTYQKVVEYAEARPDDFFLLDRPTISRLSYTSTVTPMTCLPRGSYQNMCIQGGWICWTPANTSVLERWGIRNPYQAIGEGREIFIISDKEPEQELAFIRRHYNPNVDMELVDRINNLVVYRFFVG